MFRGLAWEPCQPTRRLCSVRFRRVMGFSKYGFEYLGRWYRQLQVLEGGISNYKCWKLHDPCSKDGRQAFLLSVYKVASCLKFRGLVSLESRSVAGGSRPFPL